MNDIPDLHCPPLGDRTKKPSISGSATAVKSDTLASAGHMILEDVKGWLGSSEVTEIVGRWVPDGSALGELGATMAVAFSSAEAVAEEYDDASPSDTDGSISDEFYWLDCVHYHSSAAGLTSMLPWACWAQYRHPLIGIGDVQTLRSNLGASWKVGGEIHVTFDEDGHPHSAELTTGFCLKSEVADGLKWVSEQLSRHASQQEKPVFATVSDGEDERIQASWWSNETAHYEVFCTLGDDISAAIDSGAAPHYITVRKFLLPVDPRSRSGEGDPFADFDAEEPTMEDVHAAIRQIIAEDDVPPGETGRH